MQTAKEIRVKCEEDIKILQTQCNHKTVKWCNHKCGRVVQMCVTCEKILQEDRRTQNLIKITKQVYKDIDFGKIPEKYNDLIKDYNEKR
jgi:hypothetical protein